MATRRIKDSWDEGWSGKDVHSLDYGKDDPARPITIHESDNETLLFIDMEGNKFRVMRKKKAGF